MNICIIGGGHMGTTLACYFKHTNPTYAVTLITNHPQKFEKIIKCNDVENQTSYYVTLDTITNDYFYVSNADIIFIALPHFLIEETFKNISFFRRNNCLIGIVPGGGGSEFFFEKYFDQSSTLFGFQRVPFTAKLVEYGKETNLKSWKPFSVVGCLQRSRIETVSNQIRSCGLKIHSANNYLEIALTPTNPILHTSRIYDIFMNHSRDDLFSHKFKFYVGWTNNASEIMISMDKELHCLLNKINSLDTSSIRPLYEHYESADVTELTNKINSIPTFQTVFAPLAEININGKTMYKADTTSRMFIEDFPWGLAIFYSYFDYFNLEAPTMKKLLFWYSDYMNLDFNELMSHSPQKYGIQTKEQLINCYLK